MTLKNFELFRGASADAVALLERLDDELAFDSDYNALACAKLDGAGAFLRRTFNDAELVEDFETLHDLLGRIIDLTGELNIARALADQIIADFTLDTIEHGALEALSLTLDKARDSALLPIMRRLSKEEGENVRSE